LKYRKDGVRYVSSQALFSSTTKNLDIVIGVLTFLLVAIWVFSVFVLTIIFTLSLGERKREFGILRAIGTTKQKLTSIILTETMILCSTGAFIGVSLVCLIVFPYNTLIQQTLKTVYLPPHNNTLISILIACFIMGVATGPLASVFSILKIAKTNAFENIKEGV
jgi:putative ABC transport system permease protein